MIKVFRWLLLPFSLLYQAIVWLRNRLYDKNIFKSYTATIPTLVIGNLAVGGTGKSPMTEYLVRLLKDRYTLATLSRGYGRKTKGYRTVTIDSTAAQVGDEPLQFKRKFPEITVVVSEDRVTGIKKLQDKFDLVILDDAYQHRKLKPGYSILLFDFYSLFKPLLPLPTGDFRDNLSASRRADLLVITKCPEVITEEQKAHIEHILRKYTRSPIFYTGIFYQLPLSITKQPLPDALTDYDILLFCGIANPTPLVQYLLKTGNRVELLQFSDHYNYNDTDFEKIITRYHSITSDKKIIITTEKDIQRIPVHTFETLPLYYIPIHLKTVDQQQHTFDTFIENYLKSVKEY
ncbi:tetraacyldisaccharide 4'-kinase [Sphingobacterium sp. Mn56C]|uniref:tetraacyldisaccharide 4'-kinase n=1 Tax=Sphingobacterium sp. Mn56C TaxID=3395261 RepID=UPI003BD19CCC